MVPVDLVPVALVVEVWIGVELTEVETIVEVGGMGWAVEDG